MPGFKMFQILKREMDGREGHTQTQELNGLRAGIKLAEIKERQATVERRRQAEGAGAKKSRAKFFARKAKVEATRRRYGGFTPTEKVDLEKELLREFGE